MCEMDEADLDRDVFHGRGGPYIAMEDVMNGATPPKLSQIVAHLHSMDLRVGYCIVGSHFADFCYRGLTSENIQSAGGPKIGHLGIDCTCTNTVYE